MCRLDITRREGGGGASGPPLFRFVGHLRTMHPPPSRFGSLRGLTVFTWMRATRDVSPADRRLPFGADPIESLQACRLAQADHAWTEVPARFRTGHIPALVYVQGRQAIQLPVR